MDITQQKPTAVITLDDLAAAFPCCFFVNHEQRRPLKIGICTDLLPLVACGEEELKAVLGQYVRSDGYLLACTEGAIRIDLHGHEAGTVTASQAVWARMKIEQRERWRDKRKRKGEARKKNEAAAQRSKREAPTASSISSAHEQRLSATPRGDGFAGLRASAARRRGVAA
jgi:sRNA-binding protein